MQVLKICSQSCDGKLNNCIAVCDVSGSMGPFQMYEGKRPYPLLAAVAMSILLTQLAQPPWNGAFITFASTPQIERIPDQASLSQIALSMQYVFQPAFFDLLLTSLHRQAGWGTSTDLRKVFLDLILPMAVQNNLKPDDMVQKVCLSLIPIFSGLTICDRYSFLATCNSTPPTKDATIKRLIKTLQLLSKKLVMSCLLSSFGTWLESIMAMCQPKLTFLVFKFVSSPQSLLSMLRTKEQLMSGASGALFKSFFGKEEVAKEDEEEEFEMVAAESESEDDLDTDKPAAKVKVQEETAAEKLDKMLAAACFDGLRVFD